MSGNTVKAKGVLSTVPCAALFLVLAFGSFARADVYGPVVGFQRVQVNPGPQWVEPIVRPFTPQADEGETTGKAFSSYLGEEFKSAVDANTADWIGYDAVSDGTSQITMMWRDEQDDWRDLEGNELDPDVVSVPGFWVDLVFETDLSGNSSTRELVFSGQVIW